MQHLPNIVEHTNVSNFTNKRTRTPVTKGEFLKYLVLRFRLRLYPCATGISGSWERSDRPCSSIEGRAYPARFRDFEERFVMSLSRFRIINECFRLESFTDQSAMEDPYLPIDSFISAFYLRRTQAIIPGSTIITEECMVTWKGVESSYSDESWIPITKIKASRSRDGAEL